MDDSYEVYTQEEIDLIDSCKKITGKLLEDEEIYELILKYNYDKNKVKKELIEYIDLVNKKGDDYTWNLVQKDKNNKIHDHYLPQNRTNNQTRTQNGNLKFKSNNKFPRNYNNADFSIQQEVNKEHDPSVNSKPTNVYNKYTKETELENKKKKKKKKDRSINDLFEKALNLESKHVPQTKEEVPDKEKETVNPTQEVKPQGITIDSTFTQKGI